MAERTENSRINAYINTAGAVPALKELNTEFTKLQAEQKKLAQGSEEWKKVQKELDGVTKKVVDQTKAVNKSVMTTKQLGEYSRQLRKMRDDLVPGTAAWKALDKEITSTSKAMRGANEGTNIFSKGMNQLKNVFNAHPLLALGGILLGIWNAFKQNDTIMRIMERTTKVLGTVTGVLVDKIVALGGWLIKAFTNPKQAMIDLKDFVQNDLISKFKALGTILQGIISLDFNKVKEGVKEMGGEALKAAQAQDAITKAMQKLRDEERALLILNDKRQGQVDLLMAKSQDLNLTLAERNKALADAEQIETQMATDSIKHAEKKLSLIRQENALSSSNEEARQKEADAERELNQLKAANALKLQQIKNKASKLEQKENKQALKDEEDRQKAVEKRIKLEEEFHTQMEKLRNDARRSLLSENERELDDVRQKYARAFAIAHETGQDIVELERFQAEEIERIKEKQFQKEADLRKKNFDTARIEIMSNQEREKYMLMQKYEALMQMEGISAEQREELHKKLIKALQEIDNNYAENFLHKKMVAVQQFYQESLQFIQSAAAIQNNINHQELQEDHAKNEQLKKNLEDRYKKGLISKERYEKQVADIDKQMDEKRKKNQMEAFNREKALRIIEATINTAVAVTAAMSKPAIPPFPSAIAAGVLGGLQIGAIASTPAPAFKTGGQYLEGPSHDHPAGGMPVIDPDSGQVKAYLEGKEFITDKESTQANRDVLDWMKLNPGRRITPDVLLGNIPKFNHARVSDTVKMEKGGYLDRPAVRVTESGSAKTTTEGEGGQSLTELVTAVRSMQSTLENLKLIVPVTELEEVMETRKNLEVDNRIG
jgi:hypothetical protein